MKGLIFTLFFLAILGGVGYWYFKLRLGTSTDYQAVFLSNGQVYFGKLTDAGPSYKKLDDVHYLITMQATQSASPQSTLRKLGSEIHGPNLIYKIHALGINPGKPLAEQHSFHEHAQLQ